MHPDDPAGGGSPGEHRPGSRPVGSRSSGRLSTPSPRLSSDRSSRRLSRRRGAADEAAGTPPGHPEDPLGDPESVARAICLRLLTGQPRTRDELAAALARRGVPGGAAEAVLGRLAEVGLIDDRAFAAAWVGSRHAGRGLARRALAAELRRRGVDQATVGEAVATIDPATEERTATELVARRLSATRRLDPAVRLRRLVGMLARKGYPPALAARVVRAQFAEEGALDRLDGLDGLDGPDGPDEPIADEV
jgi:regulatory protein